ncbi:ATP-binding cassette domain-containing protein [Solwaraspora sp. WMMD1047]|uniref:ATP-binding cassette domain-containing protein n=1 Tax=Solwaraspora sp. WMMD1047 TaxID=3016102 RepID=UPI002416250B|nr:ATP-binding cassette domain-containing protein [Solwaraspora sp. WMMD1047]MDG4829674.1 ATP-binding cassette domain-containing protein [Solwaraspora sp. WMMD1047]
MAARTVVQATGIRKSYGQLRVLDGVDLTVERGTVRALLGPNGAGKTTMVRILSTLIRADAGTARVAGHDVRREPGQVRASLSLTGQYAAVDELLTGEENLVMMARLHRLGRAEARRRAAELLVEFDLADARGRLAKTYSGGMRRRLDLAVSLIARPSLIVLDEPTTGLDPRSRQQVWSVVRGLADAGVTVLLTTQYLEEADRLADRITVLDQGRVIAEGTADDLKAQVGGERAELAFATAGHLDLAAAELAGRAVRLDPPGWRLDVPTDGSADQVRQLLDLLAGRGIPVERIILRRPSLDDVFLALTARPTNRPLEGARP